MPRILVVEDEDHLAIGIKFNLEAEGFGVETAADGQSALAALATGSAPFDLVILDVMLPGMSGYAVCETVRRQGNDVPVVMLTARTLVEDRIRGFDAGTDVYLQKPFDLDELISIVRSLISRRGMATRQVAASRVPSSSARAGKPTRMPTSTSSPRPACGPPSAG